MRLSFSRSGRTVVKFVYLVSVPSPLPRWSILLAPWTLLTDPVLQTRTFGLASWTGLFVLATMAGSPSRLVTTVVMLEPSIGLKGLRLNMSRVIGTFLTSRRLRLAAWPTRGKVGMKNSRFLGSRLVIVLNLVLTPFWSVELAPPQT